jgi:hypothetical protein
MPSPLHKEELCNEKSLAPVKLGALAVSLAPFAMLVTSEPPLLYQLFPSQIDKGCAVVQVAPIVELLEIMLFKAITALFPPVIPETHVSIVLLMIYRKALEVDVMLYPLDEQASIIFPITIWAYPEDPPEIPFLES